MSKLAFAQDCSLTIRGQVTDKETHEILEFVNVYIVESGKGATTDEHGNYVINEVCPGDYHLRFSHIGCETKEQFISVNVSTEFNMEMEHAASLLEGITVIGKQSETSTQNTQILREDKISDQLDQNISNILESISGVQTIKNGNGISKPVVQGLYGNRLTILNNGIAQSGQQWGNDHSPEIDAMVANRISVVKGASALEFPGSNLGGLVLVEPSKIENEPHLHGSTSLAYNTNGRGASLNVQLHKATDLIKWKINGSLKKSGDQNTPDYFLNNTGKEEGDFAVQLEKNFGEKWFTDLYFSTFNTSLGVLRGSHIGNLTDLEAAFTSDVPFFTEETFSYAIDAPKQVVNHHLLKLHSKYFLTDEHWLDFTFSGQFNNRKEFDVRRSGRSSIPSLSLQQFTYFIQGKYNAEWKNDWYFKTGVQVNFIDNTNNPETGIIPLIPDYFSTESGVYSILTKHHKSSVFEFGVRYEYISQDVPTITQTIPREIIRYENGFHNIATSLGWAMDLSKDYNLSANVGYATRNPAVNELYSGGLHQGISGIEEGDPSLDAEKSLKSTLTFKGNKHGRFGFETHFYAQRIQDYIYLTPTQETRLTIRGAFPVFNYAQTNAIIAGFDLSGQYNFLTNFYGRLTYSYIKGSDTEKQQPLVFIPSNVLKANVNFQSNKQFLIFKNALENIQLNLGSKYVFKQVNYVLEQDFVAPPDGYFLLNLEGSAEMKIGNLNWRFFVNMSNLLDVSYRDYLNRQRYFADDIGRNITIGIRTKF
ncbi:TonB-dependent receptor [Portibacter lacus]|uniref:Membrane protein n=1 Tax=Portibacter lacus TaxID=1099794 RepID=A0AA37WBX4_9BACT|nr:TonB-dependent receptor [Portibacter lacus]GLR15433.1 membrane protein [Portibacter lacus]